MQPKINSCMWLINHEALRQWEVPLLKEAGFTQIYTPQAMPDSPAFTSGTIAPLAGDWSNLTERDLQILASQDWYAKVDSEAARIASENFDCAFVTAIPRQVMTLLKAFSGVVVVRLFGLDGDRTYSELFSFHLTPHEYEYLQNNLDRVIFASGYKELLDAEEDWIVDNSIYLPIGLSSIQNLEYKGTDSDVLAVIPRIEPNSYYEQSFLKHAKMAANANLKVAGRQHLIFKDSRILGSLKRSEFNALLSNCRAMVYASREKRHVHYHPLEAMQIGMPVVYFENTLLHSVMNGSDLGVANSLRQARKLIRKMIKDQSFAQEIGRGQREIVKSMEREELQPDFIAGCNAIAQKCRPHNETERILIILCSLGHSKESCPALQLRPNNWVSFTSVASLQNILNGQNQEISNSETISHTAAVNKVGGKFRHSRTFQFHRKYYDLTWLSPSEYEIVVCESSSPEIFLTKCEVTRVLTLETIKNLASSDFKENVETLRYSLNSVDHIVVRTKIEKELLLAYTPIWEYLVDLVSEPNS